MHFICDLEVKGHKYQGHMGQGQKSYWSRSNKDPKDRQLGSQQRQVALFGFGTGQTFAKFPTLVLCSHRIDVGIIPYCVFSGTGLADHPTGSG